MKRIFWLVSPWLAVFITYCSLSTAARAQSPFAQKYILGMNWMQSEPLDVFFDSTLNCNYYHTHSFPIDSPVIYQDSIFAKRIKSTSRMVPEDGGAIMRYSSGQRLIYQAVLKPLQGSVNAADTEHLYYFLNRHKISGDTTIAVSDTNYWRIDSSAHSLDTVLWCPEMAGSWDYRYTPNYLRLAVRLHVLNPPTPATHADSAETAITIVLREIDGAYDTTLYTFNIPWGNCTTNDKVYIDDSIIYTPHKFQLGEDGQDSVTNGYQIYVTTNRYVTTFLDYVTLMNVYADTLLTGVDIVPAPDSNLVPTITSYTYDKVQAEWRAADSLILADSLALYKRFGNGSELLYYYMQDEPSVPLFAAQARVNSDSLLKGRGATERGGATNVSSAQYRRYVAQAHPTIFWSGNWGATDNQFSAIFDTCVWSWITPDTIISIDSTKTPPDTTRGYVIDTLRKYKASQYGYFPVTNFRDSGGVIVSDSAYAMYTKLYHPASSFFDTYELGQGRYNTDLVSGHWISGRICDSAVFFGVPSGATPPKWWLANVFAYGNERSDPVHGSGYYQGGMVTPEQLSCAANNALALGAAGVIFFPPVSYNNADGPGQRYIGFADDSSKYDSNYTTYDGIRLPTLFKIRCQWLKDYGSWLNAYGSQLRPMQFLGGFSRYTTEHFTGGTYSTLFDTQSIGNINIIVPSKDSSTRPIIKHWPSVGLLYHKITLETDTLVTDTNDAMLAGDSLCLVTYGVFKDTVAANHGQAVFYLYEVNDYVDPRSLLCTYNPDSSSGYIKRGSRTLFTTMSLDSTVSPLWEFVLLDSTKTDTVLAHGGRLREYLLPGQGKILQITPYCTDTVLAGDTLTVNTGVNDIINCYVHVDSGGVFHIHKNAHVELKGFTVDKGGLFVIDTGAHLNLTGLKTNVCNGKMQTFGTSLSSSSDSGYVVITGMPAYPGAYTFNDSSVTSNAEIDAEGDTLDSSPWHLYVRATELKGVNLKGLIVVKNAGYATGLDALHIIGTTTLLGGTTAHPTALLSDPDTVSTYGASISVAPNDTLYVQLQNGNTAYSGSLTSAGTGGDVMRLQTLVYTNGVMVDGAANAQSGIRYEGNIQMGNRVAAGTTLWHILPQTNVYMGYPNIYSCAGTMNAAGTASAHDTIQSYTTYKPTIVVGHYPFDTMMVPMPTPTGGGSLTYVNLNNTLFKAVDVTAFTARHCTFTTGFGTTDTSASLELDYDTSAVVDSCSFYSTTWTPILTAFWQPTAISINDNLWAINNAPTGTIVSNSLINAFITGITTDGSACHIHNNNIDSCYNAIIVTGSQAPSRNQLIDSNGILGGNPTFNANGVLLEQADPYLYHNAISHFENGVQSLGGSSATLACNTIDSNSYGVYTQEDGSDMLRMDAVTWQTNAPAVNNVFTNSVTDIWMGANWKPNMPGVLLDKGKNSITQPAGGGYLLWGGFYPTMPKYEARQNYWGFTPTVPPNTPPSKSGGSWISLTAWDWSSWLTSGVSCAAQPDIAPPINGDTDCNYWRAEFTGQSGHFGSTCDSLISLYDAQIACGSCDSAIMSLMGALNTNCDNETQGTVREIMKELLTSSVECYGRTCTNLGSIASWFYSYASSTDSAYKKHAAMWMYAQTLEAMQYFDSAASIYNYIYTQNWAAPEDTTMAKKYYRLMRYMSLSEGSTDDCWSDGLGKDIRGSNTRSVGRAGDVPVTSNPILLEAYPNPLHSVATVSFTVPDVDDAENTTEVIVMDMMAHVVVTLAKDQLTLGRHSVTFNAANLPTGSYVVAVHTQNHMESKLMILEK